MHKKSLNINTLNTLQLPLEMNVTQTLKKQKQKQTTKYFFNALHNNLMTFRHM